MKFVWPWDGPEKYETRGRQRPTQADALGLDSKRVMEALDRVEINIKVLKEAVEMMYKQSVVLVEQRRELEERLGKYEHKRH